MTSTNETTNTGYKMLLADQKRGEQHRLFLNAIGQCAVDKSQSALETVKKMIEEKADVDLEHETETPLDVAIGTENVDVVKCLIDGKADVNASESHLHRACWSGPIMKLLFENKAQIDPDNHQANN